MIAASPRDPVYLEGFNNTGSTLAAYKIAEGDRGAITLAAGVDSVPYGVIAQDIADQARGNVQTGGIAVVLAGTAGMTAGSWIMPEAGGTGLGVDLSGSAGDNKAVIGRCEKAATVGKLGEVRLSPFMMQIAD